MKSDFNDPPWRVFAKGDPEQGVFDVGEPRWFVWRIDRFTMVAKGFSRTMGAALLIVVDHPENDDEAVAIINEARRNNQPPAWIEHCGI